MGNHGMGGMNGMGNHGMGGMNGMGDYGMGGHGNAGMGGRPMGGRNDDGNIIINNNVNSGGCDKGGNVEEMAEKIAMAVMRGMKKMMMGHGMDMPYDNMDKDEHRDTYGEDMDKEPMAEAQVEPEATTPAPKKEKKKNK